MDELIDKLGFWIDRSGATAVLREVGGGCHPATRTELALWAALGAARAEVERLRKLCQDSYSRGYQSGSRGLREMYDAIQEVKRQDAWGNAQLTEALLAAEERAERVEFENAALTAENERLKEQLTAPPGWRLVPVQPTDEMVEAYHSVEAVTACSDEDADDKWAIESYRAMLAAAPEVK